jgi:translation elongation factor EF-1beta
MAIKLSRGMSRGSFPQPPAPKLFRNIAVTFVLITIAVIAVALWTSSVKATITVTATEEPVSVDAVIDIAPSPASNQIRGRVVSGSYVEAKEYTVEVKEMEVMPPAEPTKTTGRVKITNKYSKDQPLVATTRLLTKDDQLFRITKTVTVPAGGSVEVDAISDQVGLEFEINKGIKMIIPGLWEGLHDDIYAETVTAFIGEGQASGPVAMVTADAIANAQEELYTAALETAKRTLVLEAGADPAWESVFLVTESKKQSNAAPGQKMDRFMAQVRVSVTGVFFPKDDVAALVRSKLSEKLPEGYSLSDVDMAQISFKLEDADDVNSTATLAVSAEAMSRLTETSSVFRKDAVVGLPMDEVIRKWSAIDGVQSVDVQLKPSWVHRLPSMKDKITINVQ